MEEPEPLDAEELQELRDVLKTYRMIVSWGVLGRLIAITIGGLAAFALVVQQLRGTLK